VLNVANNVFTNPKENNIDVYFIGMIVILIIVFIVGYLQSSSLQNFGTIYFYLAILTFIILSIALVSRLKLFSFVIYGKNRTKKRLLADIGIGIILGLILNLGIIGLTIGIPLSINGTASSNNLVTYIVIAFFGVLIEELFWIGSFVPTLNNFIDNSFSTGISSFFIILSILVLFIAVDYLGTIGFIFGIMFLILSIILHSKGIFNKFYKFKVNKFIWSMLIGIILITTLHVYAYGNPLTNWLLFVSAGIFFTIEGIIDYYRQSIIPSIMMHTVNNAIVGASVLGISVIYGVPAPIIMIAIMALFIYGIFVIKFVKNVDKNNVIKYERISKEY
jgi:membrane protease YdiL (CAAX protease family)